MSIPMSYPLCLLTILIICGGFCWYEDYIFRNNISFVNLDASDHVNFHLEYKLNSTMYITDEKIQSNCFDVEFTFENDSKIDSWLEQGCGTDNTLFWLRIPLFKAGVKTSILMYYNSPVYINESKGLKWSNRFGFMSTEECDTGFEHWTEMESRFPYGSSTEDYLSSFGSDTHQHSTSLVGFGMTGIHSGGPCSSAFRVGSETGGSICKEYHGHILRMGSGSWTTSGSSLPKYNNYNFCIFRSQHNQNLTFIPLNSITMFEHTNVITDWASAPDINTQQHYARGSTSASAGTTYTTPTHNHDLDFAGANFEVSGTSCQQSNGGGSVTYSLSGHQHFSTPGMQTCTVSSENYYPPYLYLNFRISLKPTYFVDEMITFQYCGNGETCVDPPLGWDRYTLLDGYFPRGNTVNLKTSGGPSHDHSFTDCVTGPDPYHGTGYADTSPYYTCHYSHTHKYSGTVLSISSDWGKPKYQKIRFIKRKSTSSIVSIEEIETQFRCNEIFKGDSDSVNMCNGHGICILPDKCSCSNQTIYSGDDCQNWNCYGHLNSGSTTCTNRHGTCFEYNNCSCHEGYLGDDCSEFYCSGIPSFSSSVCSGKGDCIGYDLCYCKPQYYFNKTISANSTLNLTEVECLRCPDGTFNDSYGAVGLSACGLCPNGTYSTNFTNGCLLCPKGSYSSVNRSFCEICPRGTYNELEGQDSLSDCKLCPPGYYGPNIGVPNRFGCIPCPLGTRNPNEGEIGIEACIPCLVGEEECPLGSIIGFPITGSSLDNSIKYSDEGVELVGEGEVPFLFKIVTMLVVLTLGVIVILLCFSNDKCWNCYVKIIDCCWNCKLCRSSSSSSSRRNRNNDNDNQSDENVENNESSSSSQSMGSTDDEENDDYIKKVNDELVYDDELKQEEEEEGGEELQDYNMTNDESNKTSSSSSSSSSHDDKIEEKEEEIACNLCSMKQLDFCYDMKHEISEGEGPIRLRTRTGGFFSVIAISLACIFLIWSISDFVYGSKKISTSADFFQANETNQIVGTMQFIVSFYGPLDENNCSSSSFFSVEGFSIPNSRYECKSKRTITNEFLGCECNFTCIECIVQKSQLLVRITLNHDGNFVRMIRYSIILPSFRDEPYDLSGHFYERNGTIDFASVDVALYPRRYNIQSNWNLLLGVLDMEHFGKKTFHGIGAGILSIEREIADNLAVEMEFGRVPFSFNMQVSNFEQIVDEYFPQTLLNFSAQIFSLIGLAVSIVGLFFGRSEKCIESIPSSICFCCNCGRDDDVKEKKNKKEKMRRRKDVKKVYPKIRNEEKTNEKLNQEMEELRNEIKIIKETIVSKLGIDIVPSIDYRSNNNNILDFNEEEDVDEMMIMNPQQQLNQEKQEKEYDDDDNDESIIIVSDIVNENKNKSEDDEEEGEKKEEEIDDENIISEREVEEEEKKSMSSSSSSSSDNDNDD